MPILPSNYTIPSVTRTPYLDRYPSPGLLNGYSISPTSSTNSIPSSLYPERSFTPRLPPTVPLNQHIRRFTPVRRSPYSAGLDVPIERQPVMFHARPLKTLTVVPSETPERSMTRSPSPTPSNYSMRSNSSLRSTRSSSCCPPRRIFPQRYNEGDAIQLEGKEESPVVFDANLTLVLGYKGKLRQNLKAIPAHQEAQTASNALSNKISNFLDRTDHVMEEWKNLGHKEDEQHSLRMKRSGGKFVGRSKSATNIMIKGFQYFSRANSCSRSSVARSTTADLTDDMTEDATEAECDEVFYWSVAILFLLI